MTELTGWFSTVSSSISSLLSPIMTVPSSVWRIVVSGWRQERHRTLGYDDLPRVGPIGASSPTIGASVWFAVHGENDLAALTSLPGS